MKYALIDQSNRKGCSDTVVTMFDTEKEALKYANYTYHVKTKTDRKCLCAFEVVAFENEDAFYDFGEYVELVRDYLM